MQRRLKQASPQQPGLKEISAHITSLIHGSQNGWLVFHLDNDQVWQQSEDGPYLPMKAGDEVTITKGLLGAYWLSAHSVQRIKVRRTR